MLNNKAPNKKSKKFTNLSLVQEIRAAADNDDGIIEGYVAVWGTTDSYNSQFQRGCFKKTIENRMNKIKVLWNHDTDQPIGKLEEIREDDHGLFIRAQLVMDIEKASDKYKLIRSGVIDCFSFGFRTIKDKFENGIQVITEVMLGEVSPVVFEANGAAKITGFRAEDFDETFNWNDLYTRGSMLFNSLAETTNDIWWGEAEHADKPMLLSAAIGDFQTAYVNWAQEWVDLDVDNVRMDVHTKNELSTEFRKYCVDGATVETIAMSTSLTIDEVRSLKAGNVIADPDRLTDLSVEIKEAHDSVRSKAVQSLCTELRSGINTAEATRIQSLLQKSLSPEPKSEVDSMLNYMNDFRNKLNLR